MVKYMAYELGSIVYAVSEYLHEGEPTNHYGVFKSIVTEVIFSFDKNDKQQVSYFLSTPSGDEWGESVSSDFVSEDYEALMVKLKDIWENVEDYK